MRPGGISAPGFLGREILAPKALVDLKLSHRTIAAEKGLQRRAKRRKESGGRKEKRKRAKQREGSGAQASEAEGGREESRGRARLWGERKGAALVVWESFRSTGKALARPGAAGMEAGAARGKGGELAGDSVQFLGSGIAHLFRRGRFFFCADYQHSPFSA